LRLPIGKTDLEIACPVRSIMQITELLITGYDGEDAVFAVTLAPNEANVVLTSTDDNGETVVDSAWRQATDAFAEVQGLLERVTRARVASFT
jgi:hypothetical protein